MSFDYDNYEIFNHMHLVREEENVEENAVPKWGFYCDGCGRDSRFNYGGLRAVLSYDLQVIVNAWYFHLNRHGISYPKPLCSTKAYIGKTTLTCIAGEEGHEGSHKFESN